ncbi:MAG: hypothetical protein QGG40_00975, partial [Myxococcota bacterium]|nr:hypothetical protein [Myxococcota bacterium]
MRLSRFLLLVEISALAAWLGMTGWFLHEQSQKRSNHIDPSVLSTGSGKERWSGIFFQDQHVGYAVTRSSPAQDGGTVFEDRSAFRIAAMGTIQEV